MARPSPPVIDPEFRTKRNEWIRCLGSKDRNSVIFQVYDLIWNAAAYRVVCEGRRIAGRDEQGQARVSVLLHNLLDRTFYQSQSVSIRRLLDTSPLKGRKGVFSVSGLLRDMQEHRALFTRQNIFAADELPMDIQAVAAARSALMFERARFGCDTGYVPRELDVRAVELLHDSIDRLCRVAADNRAPGDTVCEDVFTGLLDRLKPVERICEHVNKYLAHAATPESRATVAPDTEHLTFNELGVAHETICRCCQFVDGFLLRQTSHGFLPMYAGPLFEHLDTPLVLSSEVQCLRDAWSAYEKETEKWAHTPVGWAFGASGSTVAPVPEPGVAAPE